MIKLSQQVSIPESEIEITAIRAQGAGGQNVNKVSTAIHLRFDIRKSSLPDWYKTRLLRLTDRRINKDGIIVIKAQQFRSREKNRDSALARLITLIKGVAGNRKRRIATRPTHSSRIRRLDSKTRRGRLKRLRSRSTLDE